MEQKVQVLVDNVADSARAVLNFVAAENANHGDDNASRSHSGATRETVANPGVASSEGGTGADNNKGGLDHDTPASDASKALSKDVGQLRRLVQAAIAALRNAEIEDHQRTKEARTVAAADTTNVPRISATNGKPRGAGDKIEPRDETSVLGVGDAAPVRGGLRAGDANASATNPTSTEQGTLRGDGDAFASGRSASDSFKSSAAVTTGDNVVCGVLDGDVVCP